MKKLFSELGLSPEVLKAIDKLGFEQASPIQSAAIPILMAGRDVVGQSQTGSGKTAAFGLPAVEKVDPHLRAVQVLILCPTRELAVQVSEDLHKFSEFKRGIHPLPIYGGQSYDRQFQGLRQGAQIVIGTPGRVMDHMDRGTLRLDQVKLVVLDEADVMLDMGFRDDIETILKGAPNERQTVFFSATMPRPIQEMIQRYSKDPELVKMEQKELTVPTVEQAYFEVDRRFKVELLTRLIDLHDLKLGIIFCNTKRMVDDLVEHLNAQGYSADRLHGDMTQMMRDRVMNRFRKSGLEFLVATDVAARGLDVDHVQVVFNYDLPYDAEDYVHRIGRTGRAGRSGMAISFASGREVYQIYQIERFTKVRMQRGRLPTAQEAEEARAGVFLNQVRATLEKGEFKPYEHLVARLLEEGFASTDVAAALLQMLQSTSRPAGAGEPFSQPRERAPRDSERQREPRRFQSPDKTSAPRPRRERPAAEHRAPSPVSPPAGPGPVGQPAPPAPELPQAFPPRRPQDPSAVPPSAVPPSAVPPSAGPRRPQDRREQKPKPPLAPKHSRRTPSDQTRLFMNLGKDAGIGPGDVVSLILGHTGLPASVVGTVDLRERHLFVDVASDHVRAIVSKLNRSQHQGRNLKVKVA